MNEEKERRKEIREKLESEGFNPDELDEGEQEKFAELLYSKGVCRSSNRQNIIS